MGSFGSVYLGLNSITGELMAVKQVELPTGQSANEERKQSMVFIQNLNTSLNLRKSYFNSLIII
jgi:hypothetical protein